MRCYTFAGGEFKPGIDVIQDQGTHAILLGDKIAERGERLLLHLDQVNLPELKDGMVHEASLAERFFMGTNHTVISGSPSSEKGVIIRANASTNAKSRVACRRGIFLKKGDQKTAIPTEIASGLVPHFSEDEEFIGFAVDGVFQLLEGTHLVVRPFGVKHDDYEKQIVIVCRIEDGIAIAKKYSFAKFRESVRKSTPITAVGDHRNHPLRMTRLQATSVH